MAELLVFGRLLSNSIISAVWELRQILTGNPVDDGGKSPAESAFTISSDVTEISGTCAPVGRGSAVGGVLANGEVCATGGDANQSIADNGACSANATPGPQIIHANSLFLIQLNRHRCLGLNWRKVHPKKRANKRISRQGHKSHQRKDKEPFYDSAHFKPRIILILFTLYMVFSIRSRHSCNELKFGVRSPIKNAMTQRLMKTVALVGMMGAGKTAVGKAVAAQLGVDFLDSDAEIEKAANMTIPEIFERDGEPFFREKESQVINRLLDSAPCVLSTGGGAFLAPRNREAMSAKGVSVWLDAEIDVLWARVKNKDTRPLLRTENPYETLKSIYTARVPIYRLADVTVVSEYDVSIEDMAQRVVDALSQRPDVIENTDD